MGLIQASGRCKRIQSRGAKENWRNMLGTTLTSLLTYKGEEGQFLRLDEGYMWGLVR